MDGNSSTGSERKRAIKRRKRPADKQRVPERDKVGKNKPTADGTVAVQELSAQAQAALKLLDQETADAIIGGRSADYDALVQGMSAVVALNWAVMKTHGLRESPASLKAGAQTMTMVLQLTHYAYALGMRRGRDPSRALCLPDTSASSGQGEDGG